ncbi:glycosyltransferase [Pseudomonas sp. EYE_354]|uniref:glycosyltransferase family 2 protein n=1 Tax=Pseudomonas sp. EYE_354 TaxID=2853449 RepID=UPI002005E7C8|nr:glycosyltransferase [Pseudomonas sp. EYE_354]MCK6186798.1 glycosyltransferase [Pseudomonas sp. EYE_354]
MDSDKYLVSIVIATHNRSGYAISCVQSLLDIDSESIQVVVHDTSNDNCELLSWVKKNPHPRLLYVHWQDRLSMTENHERAVRLADGRYVCLIGDDDTVSRYIVEVAEFAKEKNIQMLTPSLKAAYYWPDFRTKNYGAAHAGRIYISEFDCSLTQFDLNERLGVALSMACQGTDGMPKLYHGLVSRRLLDQIINDNGLLLHGTSPDVSASVGLSLLGGTYHLLDFPFTMPGGGGNSNSGRSAIGTHKGNLKEDPHLTPFKKLNWPEIIPSFFSVETVWAHAAWETLSVHNNINGFNFARLYALCFFYHPDYLKDSVGAWRIAKKSKIENVGYFDVFKELFSVAARFIRLKLKRLLNPGPSNGASVIGVVDNVFLARKQLDSHLQKRLDERPISSWMLKTKK